jgi:hypothetical protein
MTPVASRPAFDDPTAMKHLPFAIACASLVLLGASAAEAQTGTREPELSSIWVNPGIKLGWTFGQGFRGFTLGAEISVVHVPANPSSTENSKIGRIIDRGFFIGWGPVLSFDWLPWQSIEKLHLGVEWVGPGIGLEMGPSVIFDRGKTHFGLSFTPWVGALVIPYYTYTVAFGRKKNLHELGLMGKLPICSSTRTSCGTNGSSGGGDWDWD